MAINDLQKSYGISSLHINMHRAVPNPMHILLLSQLTDPKTRLPFYISVADTKVIATPSHRARV